MDSLLKSQMDTGTKIFPLLDVFSKDVMHKHAVLSLLTPLKQRNFRKCFYPFSWDEDVDECVSVDPPLVRDFLSLRWGWKKLYIA